MITRSFLPLHDLNLPLAQAVEKFGPFAGGSLCTEGFVLNVLSM